MSFILDSTASVSSSSCVDLCRENFYKNKEKTKPNAYESHFPNIKNNRAPNSRSVLKPSTQQGVENKILEGSDVANTEKPRSFSPLKFQITKASTSTTSKEGVLEKRRTARSAKADTKASTVLALYGADIDYKGYKKMSSDCIVQPRVSTVTID